MTTTRCSLGVIGLAALLLTGLRGMAETVPSAAIQITCDDADGVVEVGQKVTWTVETPAGTTGLSYRLTNANKNTIQQGKIDGERNQISGSLAEPGWLYLEINAAPDGAMVHSAGALVAPEKIKPASPVPDDFDAFWEDQVRQIEQIPANPRLVPVDSEKPGVQLFDLTLDNVEGKHVRAYVARPEKGDKLPAVVIYQWAGVYPLQKSLITNRAASGWLVINVMAHDLPLAESAAFYEEKKKTTHRYYEAIGHLDRTTSYFRPMLLGDYQAINYVTSRPDWDGKTLAVFGASQGGFQAIAMAGLHPKVTAMVVKVPAGCDTQSESAGRQPGWPYWHRQAKDDRLKTVMEVSSYYDPVNFAHRIRCPALVGAALRDTTAPPGNIFAMYNQIPSAKQIVVMPHATHQLEQQPIDKRGGVWFESLRTTGVPPATSKP